MDRAKENQKKWDKFLSTIKTEKKEQHTQPITITVRKAGIQCLAYNFSRQLLDDSDLTVTVTGRTEDISTIADRTDVSETFVPIKKSKSFPEHKGTPVVTTGSGEKRKSSEMETSKDKTADGMIRDVDLMRKDTMQEDNFEKQVKDTRTVEDANGLPKAIPDNYEEENGTAKVTPAIHVNDTRGLDMNMSKTRHNTDLGYKKSSGDSRSLETKEEEEMTENVPHSTFKMSGQLVGSIKSDHAIQRTRERNEPSPKKVKKDIDTPCSKWKMDLFSKHFDFDSTVSPLSIQAISSPQIDAIGVQIKEEVMKRCKIMIDKISEEATNDFFKGMRSNETTVRILLDAIFLTLCSSLGYNIEVAKNIKSTILVPCVFDYRILHKGNVIGSIEAKSSEGLKKESIIQAVLQLTILQAEIIQRGAESPPPLFNIVTDGVRFIFIQLKGEKLGFEHNHLSKLHINRVESITDLEKLLPKLVALVQMSKSCTSA
ncbi:hypothetical protein FSP39_010912 [Pinctada imbricata]|uniref:Uncharacterized protein n=1 Tax=Pinctada imbricata TaxID=66713 RepID=A0AA88XGU2_PINIB|nr:hypothetical protein FSP39_010912 [Pinctada imbricata]